MFTESIFRFVLQHLVGKITLAEIEEMIQTVDKNKDGKISYSEFRVYLEAPGFSLQFMLQVMLGAIPLVINDETMKTLIEEKKEKNEKVARELNYPSEFKYYLYYLLFLDF